MAGLLDYLFDPGTFQGNGGLLSRLRPSLANIPQSQGFQNDASPIAVGGYQMPRMGDQAQFTPQQEDPAALPPNAQPTQGQLPMQQPGLGDRLGGGIRALGNPGGLINRVADAVTTIGGGTTPQNQTAQFLVSRGLDPALAKTIVADPMLLRAVLPQAMGMGGQTDDIKEYQFAKREDPSLTFEKFMARKKAVSGEYSLTPQYGTNEKGETVLIQTGKSGEAIQTKLPPGVKISSGVEKVDLGTEWGLYDKRTGNLVGRQAKDLQGKEAAEERGKIQGQAQGELPAAEMTAKRTIDKIDQFANSKGFKEVFGQIDQFMPNALMSDAGRDALSRFTQLEGSAFLEGRAMLKGGGAITDFESKKAEAAIARLSRSLNENDARKALEEFKDAVRAGAEKLRAKANGAAPQMQPSPQPSSGLPSGWSVRVR